MESETHLAGARADLDAALARLAGGEVETRAGALDRVAAARAVREHADRLLAAAVAQARAAGCTWQVIGDVLGTTRQAAFQRFGRPIDPRTGKEMDRTIAPGSAERASEIFELLTAAQWDAVTQDFDDQMAAALSSQGMADTWAQIVGMVGALESSGEPFARRMGDLTVVDVPLTFEAGDMVGRISLRPDLKIAGLFVLDPKQAGGS